MNVGSPYQTDGLSLLAIPSQVNISLWSKKGIRYPIVWFPFFFSPDSDCLIHCSAMHTNASRDLRPALCAIKAQQTVTVRLLRRWRRRAEISGRNKWTAGGNSCRASPSCLIFFRLDVTYGAFHVGERVLLTSTWISRGGFVERGRQHEKVARMTGRKQGREGWIQGDPWLSWKLQRNSKLHRFLFLLARRTWVASSLRGYPYLGDPGLPHIYLVRECPVCRCENREAMIGSSGNLEYRFDLIAIILASGPLYRDWRIYLRVSESW